MMKADSRPSLSRGESDITVTSATSSSFSGVSSVEQSSRPLLFGEIPTTPTTQSNCSKSSVCNLVLSSSSSFLRFWLSENCRNAFLNQMDQETLPSLRLVCHNFAATAAPCLFEEINITFKSSTFKPSRTLSLNRIGQHVKRLTFKVPHSADSFLPPILDSVTGEQISFNYKPQVEPMGNKDPKYGTMEMTDLLIRQYPPIFHAATNIPAFIRALSTMPNIEHMTIFSPDQNMSPRYRRSTADYTLVSLRIAIERAPLHCLSKLSLKAIHPSALLYLQPVLSYGSTPNSCRRWTQIKELNIEMDSTPFSWPKSEDQLRVVEAYLRAFSTSLSHLSFRWTGRDKGPSPLSADPCLSKWPANPHAAQHSPTRPGHPKSIRFFNLKYLVLEHATMESEQVATFITNHRQTLIEFCFEDVSLKNGDWRSTLDPLRKLRRNERNKMKLDAATLKAATYDPEEMDVPCKLSPVEIVLDDPVIMDTLEPQNEQPAPWMGLSKNLGVRKWFDRSTQDNNKPPKRQHQRKVSDHLKRVLNGNIFSGWL